jgi:hypothetical protein
MRNNCVSEVRRVIKPGASLGGVWENAEIG